MLTLYDKFSGAGGSTTGAATVPGVRPARALNHHQLAIDSHAANFPDVDHICESVERVELERLGRADLLWASPACPAWTDARGKRRDFDRSNQAPIPGLDAGPVDELAVRSRALMEEVPRYLRYCVERRSPVLAGVVENVIQCRRWAEWHRWLSEIRTLGYEVRVIAFNSMHARPIRSPRAPQSRDRLYVAFWHVSLGRRPDWDRWLRPKAWCSVCDEYVAAVQVFKRPGFDMGRYGPRQQYVYRCPRIGCRNRIVEPEVAPAAAAIDWSIEGIRIGEREARGLEPLAPATLERIRAGIRKFWSPVLTPAGGTWRSHAAPVTRGNDGLAVPSLLVPVEGRPGKQAAPAESPMRTQTARNETGIAPLSAFVTPLRGGGDKGKARPTDVPLSTVTAAGNHHGLVLPAFVVRNNGSRGDGGEHCTKVDEPLRTLITTGHQSVITSSDHLLVPYYSTGSARPSTEPIGTLSTRDRYGIAGPAVAEPVIEEVRFRMLTPEEIGRAMAFTDNYTVLGSKRDRVRQYGNAVTPPVAEVLVSALVEAISGEQLPR